MQGIPSCPVRNYGIRQLLLGIRDLVHPSERDLTEFEERRRSVAALALALAVLALARFMLAALY